MYLTAWLSTFMKINKHSDKKVTALLKINMFHSLYKLSGKKI